MRGVDPVAAHAPVAAVKDLGVQRVVGRRGPVPVGQGALVAALTDEGLLVVPREEAVPRQEVCRIVDCLRLVDVDGDEVVVPRLGPCGEAWVCEGGLGHEAECGVDVGHPLLSRESCPVGKQVSQYNSTTEPLVPSLVWFTLTILVSWLPFQRYNYWLVLIEFRHGPGEFQKLGRQGRRFGAPRGLRPVCLWQESARAGGPKSERGEE